MPHNNANFGIETLVFAEVSLGVAVQHLLQHLARIAFRVPVGHHLLVPEHREITAEHDAIGQGLPGGKGIVLDHAHPRHIDAVAARFPQLRILAARPAYPWQDDMLAVLAHKPNVSYELHGWGPRQYSPALKKAIAGRLADRVMFGCDFPVLRYEKVMADWNAEGYSREVLEKVLYRNAETYFGADQGGNR